MLKFRDISAWKQGAVAYWKKIFTKVTKISKDRVFVYTHRHACVHMRTQAHQLHEDILFLVYTVVFSEPCLVHNLS